MVFVLNLPQGSSKIFHFQCQKHLAHQLIRLLGLRNKCQHKQQLWWEQACVDLAGTQVDHKSETVFISTDTVRRYYKTAKFLQNSHNRHPMGHPPACLLWVQTLIHVLPLTHWGRVTHICVGKLTIIDSDNGLLPGRHQTIIWTNAGILLIGPLGTHFNGILISIQTFSFKKMHLKMLSAKWRPFCLGLNVLITAVLYVILHCIGSCYIGTHCTWFKVWPHMNVHLNNK